MPGFSEEELSPYKQFEKERKCLKCNETFMSKSVGNRICTKCHKSNTGIGEPTSGHFIDKRPTRKQKAS